MQPTDEQFGALDLFREGESMVIDAGAGTGKTSTLMLLASDSSARGQYLAFNKALRADQPVATPDGWSEIGALGVGDEVFGLDGVAHRVTKVIDRGLRPLYEVAFSDGTTVVADADHLWSIERTHSGNTTYVRAAVETTDGLIEHLAANRRIRLPQQAPLDLPHADLIVDPWLLGVLLGDGSLGHGRAWVTNVDDWVFAEIERRVPESCSVRFIKTGARTARTAAIVGPARGRPNPLLDRLRLVGVYGLTAADKIIPHEYLWSSYDQRLALLRGLMDTDGSVGAAAVTPIFTSTSPALADGVVFLTQSLGGTASKRLMHAGSRGRAPAYQVTVRLPAGLVPFARPSRLAVRRDRTHDRLLRRRVVAIEPVAPARAICIAIESDDHLFLTAGLIPTHNSIVEDVQPKLPPTCAARTAHSLAYAAVGREYRHRLNGNRQTSQAMARILGIRPYLYRYGGEDKRLSEAHLASHVMNALRIFCQTADEAPTHRHFPYIDGLDWPDADGKRTYANNNALTERLLGQLQAAWADVQNKNGRLRYEHAHYLKMWQLRDPHIPADYIMFDEAQDASKVMAAIVAAQSHAQCVYVGDANQAIYGWAGAIDAMDGFDSKHRTALTQSFRFGPPIAFEANDVLMSLRSELLLKGLESIASVVGPLDGHPDVTLCRTNAATIMRLLETQAEGRPVHLVGDGKELLSFARAAEQLKAGRKTNHPELVCFDTWAEVQEYVEHDPSGSELALLVKLIEKFGADKIVEAIDGTVPEGPGVTTISTTHKAKGREWDRVLIDASMGEFGESEDELRLRYVAFTRARHHLDLTDYEIGLARAEERARR